MVYHPNYRNEEAVDASVYACAYMTSYKDPLNLTLDLKPVKGTVKKLDMDYYFVPDEENNKSHMPFSRVHANHCFISSSYEECTEFYKKMVEKRKKEMEEHLKQLEGAVQELDQEFKELFADVI